ncbi:hypothetical protein AXFE_33840 [Acidithrix ferrooxidans]|uniref:Uncharacterized protein n=1 Tax=Acidithrix ferrooxidans TaxID=1280514 RepID=A0A0D8HCZ0_9ACTN|nr:hypothetical protein AXFE_33840 [Acidithrix ferrooxidans]
MLYIFSSSCLILSGLRANEHITSIPDELPCRSIFAANSQLRALHRPLEKTELHLPASPNRGYPQIGAKRGLKRALGGNSAETGVSFKLLRVGGVLAFDDYLWFEQLPYGQDPIRSPKPAIDAFTMIFGRKLNYIHVGYQLYVTKTAN